VGETGNIEQRLRLLFRCYISNNPHPCHSFYQTAYKAFPTPDVFCDSFHAEVENTDGKTGRIEIEEGLQNKYNTNHSDYYANWTAPVPQTTPAHNPPQRLTISIRAGHKQYKQFTLIRSLANLVGGPKTNVYVRFKGGPRITGCIGQSRNQKYINGAEFRKEFQAFANSIAPGKNSFFIEIEYWNSNPCLNFQ